MNRDENTFRQLIQEIQNQTLKVSSKADKTSLLNNVKYYEYAFNQGLFDLDYLRNFYDIYFKNKIPMYLISLIFDHIKKYTDIAISPYNRDERRNQNLNILKSCMIYHHVFEHFLYFAYLKNPNGRQVPEIPDETLDIPIETQNYIVDQWNHITENTQLVHQNIVNELCRINDRIYGVIMFQFYNLIFILPIKKIRSPQLKLKIIDTKPILLPNVPPYSPPMNQPIEPRRIPFHPELYIPPGTNDLLYLPPPPPQNPPPRPPPPPPPPQPPQNPPPQNDLGLFQTLIHQIEGKALKRTNEGDKNSLLHKVQMYQYAFNNRMLDFDYIRNFHDIYFKEIPLYIIALIFDQVKKYTGIDIPPYNRDERTYRNCSILKGCMIYRDVYEHFTNFIFKRDVHRTITKDQDVPNETLDIPNELKNYILQNWGPGIDSQGFLNSLMTINPRIYGVIMFQFYNLIFVIPVKRINLANISVWKIIDTQPIPLTNAQPPPQINPPQILNWRQMPQPHPLINPYRRAQYRPPPPQQFNPPLIQIQPPPPLPQPPIYQPPQIIQQIQPQNQPDLF